MKRPLSKIAEFISATNHVGTAPAVRPSDLCDEVARGYSIDSRTVAPGELFFAVKGERLDGHNYVDAALEKGAVAAVVQKAELHRYSDESRLLAVDDTLVALQTLATAVRKLWGKPLIGVTGWAGKPRTKGPVAHVLPPR